MNFFGLTIIIISAIFHAWWNFLLKKSHDKMVFIWLMFCEASLIMICLYLVYFLRFGVLSCSAFQLSLIAAASYFLYQVGNGLAYETEDMSLVYPLTMTAPLFIPIWAWLILHETISLKGFMGIILCVIGVCIIPLKDLNIKSIIKPFSQFKSKGVKLALFAGFISSIGAVINKLGLNTANIFSFTFSMVLAITLLLGLFCLGQKKYRENIPVIVKKDTKNLMLAGIVLTASFLSFQSAISITKISYASPARRISILFGVLIGVIFLKEKCAKIRIIGSLLIISGIWLLKIA